MNARILSRQDGAVVRTPLAAVAVALLSAVGNAEQVEPTAKSINPAVPTQQKLIIRSEDLFPLTKPTRLGVFTLVPPHTNGEVLRLSIPVGEFATRAAHAISEARRHHAERKVDERIAHELRVFNLHRADTPP
jgi:hypothetical protein